MMSGGRNLSLAAVLSRLSNLTPAEERLLLLHTGARAVEDLRMRAALADNDTLRALLRPGVHHYILLTLPPLILLLGLLGNVVSLLILVHRSLRRFSTYLYLSVLSVADSLVLLLGLGPLWLGHVTGANFRNSSPLVCKVGNVIGYTLSDWSVWLLVAVTAERCVAVCFPYKASRFCTRGTAARLVVGCLLVLLAVNLHFLWTVDVGGGVCQARPAHVSLVHRVWPWVDLALYSTLPFILISLCNVLIVMQVWHTRHQSTALFEMTSRTAHHNGRSLASHYTKTMVTADNASPTSCSVVMVTPEPLHRQTTYPSSGVSTNNGSVRLPPESPAQQTGRHDYGSRLTVMLLAISSCFLVCTLPVTLYGIYVNAALSTEALSWSSRRSLEQGRVFVELLMYIHHRCLCNINPANNNFQSAANFYLYCATGTKFRRQFMRTFLCRRPVRSSLQQPQSRPRAPRWGRGPVPRANYLFSQVPSGLPGDEIHRTSGPPGKHSAS